MSNVYADFDRRVEKALSDELLQKALPFTQDRMRFSRQKTMDDMGNFEDWRKRAKAIRTHTMENLDYYLDVFAKNAEENGSHVFFASTGEEAVNYILGVMADKEAKTVVKSKSMVSEELHLNTALENEGIRVVETDLGEYIIQLAGETPSHLIAPAIHKSKEQVAELFSKEAQRPLPAETKELCAFAREKLRQDFLQADVGISGCNLAVAESGSVTLVSNEGNARMSTTLPKTHIVLMGMERIVPTWEEIDPVITMLTRSATGQKISVYYTAITGPRKADDTDGPEEVHIVILDNGRSNAIGTKYQSVLGCIRCGACLNVCPVYRHVGGHAYGSVYSGPIGSILSPILEGYDKHAALPDACTLCGACTEVCPVGIDIHDIHLLHRMDKVEQGHTRPIEKTAMKWYAKTVTSPMMYKSGTKLAYIALGLMSGNEDYVSKGFGLMNGWTKNRDLPKPKKESFREWWNKERGNK